MANVYDIARIKSGDPMGRASEGAKEASTLLNQYKHQKEIIDEINKAIKDAEKKAKKNKFGYGLGGSLMGMLLGGLATGGTSTLPQLLSSGAGIAGAGAGGYAAEKFRQDRVDSTKELKKLEKSLKGRAQLKDVEKTRDVFEDQLDNMLLTDTLSSMVGQAIAPTNISFSPGISASIGLDKELLKGVLPEWAQGIAGMKGMNSPLVKSLLRALGPQAGELFYGEPAVSPYSAPQFRNPYGGGGGY